MTVKKFMTKDPFIFKPTDTIWLKVDGEWKKFGPLNYPAQDAAKVPQVTDAPDLR